MTATGSRIADMTGSTTALMQHCLRRLQADEETARAELLGYSRRRLKELADQMFAQFPRLHSREQEDDLLQEAMMRLWKSLEAVGPATVPEFMGLAALQMRRALLDLTHYHFGRKKGTPDDPARRHIATLPTPDAIIDHTDDSNECPETLMMWAEFHQAAEELPEPERTAFDLLYYGELPQLEVAELMGVTDRQIRRYWWSARRMVGRKMDGLGQEI